MYLLTYTWNSVNSQERQHVLVVLLSLFVILSKAGFVGYLHELEHRMYQYVVVQYMYVCLCVYIHSNSSLCNSNCQSSFWACSFNHIKVLKSACKIIHSALIYL